MCKPKCVYHSCEEQLTQFLRNRQQIRFWDGTFWMMEEMRNWWGLGSCSSRFGLIEIRREVARGWQYLKWPLAHLSGSSWYLNFQSTGSHPWSVPLVWLTDPSCFSLCSATPLHIHILMEQWSPEWCAHTPERAQGSPLMCSGTWHIIYK